MSATAQRVWGELKAKLGGGDQTLLETAEKAEGKSVAAYAKALEQILPFPVRQLLCSQAAPGSALSRLHQGCGLSWLVNERAPGSFRQQCVPKPAGEEDTSKLGKKKKKKKKKKKNMERILYMPSLRAALM